MNDNESKLLILIEEFKNERLHVLSAINECKNDFERDFKIRHYEFGKFNPKMDVIEKYERIVPIFDDITSRNPEYTKIFYDRLFNDEFFDYCLDVVNESVHFSKSKEKLSLYLKDSEETEISKKFIYEEKTNKINNTYEILVNFFYNKKRTIENKSEEKKPEYKFGTNFIFGK
ncbi:hypothetical protein KY334_08245 [Candidatus Woesearchaeota archaeon]|nr:hypothetical protein [Candidatus Woesearchaeota archaeon]